MNLFLDTASCMQQILRNLTFLKYEIKQVLSNQAIIMQRLETTENMLEQNSAICDNKEQNNVDLTNCPLPIDNDIDLTTLEDKISGDRKFKDQLVSLKIFVFQLYTIYNCIYRLQNIKIKKYICA